MARPKHPTPFSLSAGVPFFVVILEASIGEAEGSGGGEESSGLRAR
ncbi:MAG TPA: hypothetical protein VLH15_05180 [Dehalococcoidales bacterium]|nr:hypothetical protein [Dehalococcoidales bacterium]